MKRTPFDVLVGGAILTVLTACASSPPATAALSQAGTLIDQAARHGGQRYAAADLERARQRLREANEASLRGDHDIARARATEASADARLAIARAGSAEARAAAEEMQQSLDTLRAELAREPKSLPVSRAN